MTPESLAVRAAQERMEAAEYALEQAWKNLQFHKLFEAERYVAKLETSLDETRAELKDANDRITEIEDGEMLARLRAVCLALMPMYALRASLRLGINESDARSRRAALEAITKGDLGL